MAPEDVVALMEQAHRSPENVSLHFHTTENEPVVIKLSQILFIAADNDPILGTAQAKADYRGQIFSNRAVGSEKNIPTPFVIDLGSDTKAEDIEKKALTF